MGHYNIQLYQFGDGTTMFTALRANGVYVEPSATIGGPDVMVRIETNTAGAVIDLDGTAPAALIPPRLTFNMRFVATYPNNHTEYENLIALKGKHGTLRGRVGGVGYYPEFTVAARLVEVEGSARGVQLMNTESFLVVKAVWQLKGFI